MTAKEFLTQAYRLDDRINSLERELKTLRSAPISNYNNTGGGRPSENVSPTEAKALKSMALEELIESEKSKLEQIRYNIHTAIGGLAKIDEQLVLRYRYIERSYNGKMPAWEVIAEKMHYDLRQVYRIHGKALEHLQF